ncbi:MAG: citrate/2-methylcitrate synthase, partial [Planctomycetota bacterium]
MQAHHRETREITEIILRAAEKARRETGNEPEPDVTRKHLQWPLQCEVGPGLEGAIACESRIGYVNGSKGWLIYQGYDIFDLCAHSTFEEVSYLLLHGHLPNAGQLEWFKKRLSSYRYLPRAMRQLMTFPVQDLNTMAALRIGVSMMRQTLTYRDAAIARPEPATAIGTDEDSIPMEVAPYAEPHAKFEFKRERPPRPKKAPKTQDAGTGHEACYHLISGVATITAGIHRLRDNHLPLEPDPELSHAGNLLYMMTGRRPTPVEERVMDVALILHADHGMNASTFASMVVASTLSDIYWAIGSGIAALSGPLHGGANEQVLHVLREIGEPGNVEGWFARARSRKRKIMGFGHRVYKAYDPRARVLGPLARHLVTGKKEAGGLFRTARALEKKVVEELGASKSIFPNVDFFSGIVYSAMGIPADMFTPIFAVSRVSGWTARVLEYLGNNRIF